MLGAPRICISQAICCSMNRNLQKQSRSVAPKIALRQWKRFSASRNSDLIFTIELDVFGSPWSCDCFFHDRNTFVGWPSDTCAETKSLPWKPCATMKTVCRTSTCSLSIVSLEVPPGHTSLKPTSSCKSQSKNHCARFLANFPANTSRKSFAAFVSLLIQVYNDIVNKIQRQLPDTSIQTFDVEKLRKCIAAVNTLLLGT